MPRAFSGCSLDPGKDEEAADPDPTLGIRGFRLSLPVFAFYSGGGG